uniref:Uncharacterized protein n=1 Tax=Candidatus Kentrum sp. FM TaxID=2126340 RepID=A0A450SML7_9GAMM|nr:MAG: hypothetical protein BECKFM1743A_GA0114220_101078 [Candidatus Kentron sp. FM]VFJ54965.1 MAG: hypothetical protein BECKFM1743C_GA0114222_101488 [Candidatus Kentron sp. FM]
MTHGTLLRGEKESLCPMRYVALCFDAVNAALESGAPGRAAK